MKTCRSTSDTSPFRDWIPELRLGRACRPGLGTDRRLVPAADVSSWIAAVKACGVRSVVCLLDEAELGCYAHLPSGLIGAYRDAGLDAASLPITPDEPWTISREELALLDELMIRLPRPVVIHCSAGQVRSGRAIEHLVRQAARAKPVPIPSREAEILRLIQGCRRSPEEADCAMRTGAHGMLDYGRLAHLLKDLPLAYLDRYLSEIDAVRATSDACLPCSLKFLAFCMAYTRGRLPARHDNYTLAFKGRRRDYRDTTRDFQAEIREACKKAEPPSRGRASNT